MYIVYSINYDSYDLEIYGNYREYKDADKGLYETVISFIEDNQGKKNAKIHYATPSEDYNEIMKEIKEGYFVNKEGDNIVLYLRERIENIGYIYSTIETRTERVCFYGIKGEHEELESKKTRITTKTVSDETLNNYEVLISELKDKLKMK